MNKIKKFRLLTAAIITLLMMIGTVVPASGQEDTSEFSETFQVFMQSRDAFQTYDLTPADIVYPLPDDYRTGPGDILQIVLSGMINDVMVAQIGPQGDIYVHPAGILKVENLTIDEVRGLIDSELSDYLINYECSVQLLKSRRIQIYLLGQVRQPGLYIALAGSTAIGVIQTAGTLVTNPVTINFDEREIVHPYFRALTSGAGRIVEVWRDGERVGRVDIAQVAVGGRSQNDIMLEDGDALFIPQNQNPVIVRGGVSRPGTYELRNNDTVLDLIAQAGGYRSMMMLSSVQVERRNPDDVENPTSLIELNLTDPDFNPRDFHFQPGDILRVPEVIQQVYVLGAVWMPQAVDYHEGWNALDYIAATGGPVSPTDESAIQVINFPMTEQQTVTQFNIKNIYMQYETVEAIPIEPGDMIWVPWENQPFYGVGVTNAIATILGQTLGILRIVKDIG
jgi:protein involved in polysaccharide export with SLBB domain